MFAWPSATAPFSFMSLKRTSREWSEVEVKVPMKVVDALFSGDKDELDLVAGLRALSSQGDYGTRCGEGPGKTVCAVWLDSKNISD